MKKLKIIIIPMLMIVMLFFGVDSIFASNNITYVPFLSDGKSKTLYYKDNEINTIENSTLITGLLPLVTGDSSDLLNAYIDNIYDEKVMQATNSRAKEVNFSYDAYLEERDYLSLVIKTTIKNVVSKTEANTVVFNLKTGKIINLETYAESLNINMNFINDYLNKIIKYSPRIYVDNFNGVSNNHPYYIRGSNLVLVFDGYEFLKNESDISFSIIPVESVTKYILPKNAYYTSSQFNMKMIPVRLVSENFEYTISWSDILKAITVSKGSIRTNFKIGSNMYQKNNVNLILEMAPEIRNNKTYVPITFFAEILEMSYSTDESGNIIFYEI